MTADAPPGQPGELPSEDQILRGADQPPEDAVEVRAGDLSAEFTAGGLRYLRMGDIEVARRIVVAVRDQAWNTVPAALSDVRIHQTGDEFRITFVSRHEAGELCFIWKGIIGDGCLDSITRNVASKTAAATRKRIVRALLQPTSGAFEIP